MSDDAVFIVAARRTPIGAFQGALSAVPAPQLGAAAAAAAIADSGLKAIMLAADQLRTGDIEIALAGGLESMSNAPYLLMKARSGYRMGPGELLDHMFTDGLQSPWDGQLMGTFAEATSEKYGFTRADQDSFAAESVKRALRAVESGAFQREITPVKVKSRKGETLVERDETPFTCDLEKIPSLKPAFKKDGTVTAASSSSISDGAAAAVLARGSAVKSRGLKPLARIVAYTSHAQEPAWFTTAPVGAIRKLLEKTGWRASEVDLYEVNEAFACVSMAAMKDIGIDHARINVNGGACALGHPIGRGGKRGIAALCIGGGEATAIAVEVV